MKLYFGSSLAHKREIADCANGQEVTRAIEAFIEQANARKPKDARPFVRYYTRIYRQDQFLVYDVGSHTEFFFLLTNKDPTELYRNPS